MSITMAQSPLSFAARDLGEYESPLDYEPSTLGEYTQRHRVIWPLLLRGAFSETLNPADRRSWAMLWGRDGENLYRCFFEGDPFVRADMIALARRQGGWRGKLVAEELEVWEASIPAPLFHSVGGDLRASGPWGIEGVQ